MLNNYSAIGRLTRDPEVKYTSGSQMAICRFKLAIDRPASKDREKVTDFIPCIIMGKQAENMEKFVGKGNLVGIEGRIQTGSYEKDGQTVYTTDVFCSKVHFLEWKKNDSDRAFGAAPSADQSGVPMGFAAIDEQIPF